MRRLTFENSRGERIVFYRSPFLIESLTGIGEVEADIQGQQAPFQDGDTYIDTRLHPRFITLEGAIANNDFAKIRELRRDIMKVCNPKFGIGKLTLELDGDLKEIYGVLDGSPAFPERGNSPYQKFMVVWKCPSPYWLDEITVSEPMTAFIGEFVFPITFPTRMGIQSEKRVFVNEGDVETPVFIEFTGPSVAPEVRNNTTGEFLRVDATLEAGDVLTINTEFGKKRVEINGQDAIHWIADGSTFWQLVPGENEVEYTAYSGQEDATVSLTFRNRYVGV